MKVKIKDMEIECTVDEFEELYTRGILDNKMSPAEALKEFIIDNPPKDKSITPIKSFPGVVAVYGCQMPETVALYGCQVSDPNRFRTEITSTDTKTEKDDYQ